jgi:hypothetical protein
MSVIQEEMRHNIEQSLARELPQNMNKTQIQAEFNIWIGKLNIIKTNLDKISHNLNGNPCPAQLKEAYMLSYSGDLSNLIYDMMEFRDKLCGRT